jgi:hypothetical protein
MRKLSAWDGQRKVAVYYFRWQRRHDARDTRYFMTRDKAEAYAVAKDWVDPVDVRRRFISADYVRGRLGWDYRDESVGAQGWTP